MQEGGGCSLRLLFLTKNYNMSQALHQSIPFEVNRVIQENAKAVKKKRGKATMFTKATAIERCIDMYNFIFFLFEQTGRPFNEFMSIHNNAFFNQFTGNYNKILEQLKEMDLVECKEVYNYLGDKKFTKKYRLNNKYLLSNPGIITKRKAQKKIAKKGKLDPIIKVTKRVYKKYLRFEKPIRTAKITGKYIQEVTPEYVLRKYIKLNDNIPNIDYVLANHYNKELPLSKIKLIAKQRGCDVIYFRGRCYVKNKVSFNKVRKEAKYNDEIPEGTYQMVLRGQFVKKSLMLDLARLDGQDLILYKGKLHVGNLAKFIERKVSIIRNSRSNDYVRIKNAISGGELVINRNDTNLRLDHPCTFSHSEIINELLLNKQKINQFDLSNSQFAILAALIKYYIHAINEDYELNLLGPDEDHAFRESIKSVCDEKNGKYILPSDINKFIYLTQEGQFYEYFANEVWSSRYKGSFSDYESFYDLERAITDNPENEALIEQKRLIRGDAKTTCFLVVFASHFLKCDAKDTLIEAFPNLVEFTDKFKRIMSKSFEEKGLTNYYANKKGSASFPVMLQNVESGIFVDRILVELQKAGLIVLTKHDSVLYPESEKDAVKKIMVEILDDFFGEANYDMKGE